MIKLIHGDCFAHMRSIEDHSVDLILTDPPYGLKEYSTGNMKFKWRNDINNDIAEWDIALRPEDVIDEWIRIIKDTGNIFVFCDRMLLSYWGEVFKKYFDTFVVFFWHRTNPVPKFRKSGFLHSIDMIACFWNKGHTWNFTKQNEMHNFLSGPKCGGKERLKNPKHPTQKPLYLLEHLIKIASNEGDLVFDPFMGVGSTGVACKKLNRGFIGIEKEQDYFDAARMRLEQENGLIM